MKMIRRALTLLDGCRSFLDAPCGAGRATIMLAEEGHEATGIDLGRGALEVAREQATARRSEAQFLRADVQNMPFEDARFDAVLCFRLYHHFPVDEVRERTVRELCRVARRYVLISYLSPYAYTSLRRELLRRLGIGRSAQYPTRLAGLRERFARHGFRLVADIPRQRFVHTLHLAVFERVAGAS
jgi:SAM-dependent methyltransferase